MVVRGTTILLDTDYDTVTTNRYEPSNNTYTHTLDYNPGHLQ